KKPAMVETGASSTDRLRPGLMSAWGQTRTFGDGTQCPLCLAPRKQTWLNALRVAAQDRGNRGEKQRRPPAIACATAVEEAAAAGASEVRAQATRPAEQGSTQSDESPSSSSPSTPARDAPSASSPGAPAQDAPTTQPGASSSPAAPAQQQSTAPALPAVTVEA